MYKFLLAALFLTGAFAAQSQTVKGKIVDLNDEKPLARATVELIAQKDTTQKQFTITDSAGNFIFKNIIAQDYFLQIGFVGYSRFTQVVAVSNTSPVFDLGKLLVAKKVTDLDVVTVVSRTAPVTQKGDTAQYSASQFKVNPDANVEDLVKKMPGIAIGRDGTVTAQGEQVKKVTIDGKDFFGDDASAALKNLPSSVVDKIQVFDRMSDQAQLTGFDDGNSVKAINIVTKSGVSNGQFGRVYAGYGTDDRYAAGGNMSFFKSDRRISLVGNFNNVNQQNFGSQDLLGVTSSSNSGRGGMRGGGGGFGGGESFQIAQQNGISTTTAFGINYADKWAKKINVTGSYFFNQSKNINDRVSHNDNIVRNQTTDENSSSESNNLNHRINMRIEYKIDSFNTLMIIPSLNFQKNESRSKSGSYTLQNQDSLNLENGFRDIIRDGYNLRNNLLFRHTFKNNRRRSYAIGFNQSFNKNNSETYAVSNYRFFKSTTVDSLQNQYTDNPTNGYTLGGNLSYVEPMGKKGQLQLSYRPSFSKNNADQRAYNYDTTNNKYADFEESQSNTFQNTTTTHNGGLTYRMNIDRENNFSIGVELQHSQLESERIYPNVSNIDQAFTNLLPNAMLQTAFSKQSKLRLFYRASTRFPSVTQLQDVLNTTNLTSITIGNPNLKQSYNHFLGTRFSFTNTQKGQSFFANIFMNAQQNYISNAFYSPAQGQDSMIVHGITVQKGTQLNRPVNLNGYKNFNSFLTYSQPLKFLKSNITLSGGFVYLQIPSMSNDITYSTENFTYNAGLGLSSNINEFIDFNINYNAGFNNPKSTSPTPNAGKYINQTLGAQLNLLTKSGWFLQNDIAGESYSGLSGSQYNQRYWLWNAAMGKKFLKNKTAELKLSVFDLLKQNQSISRQITEYGITDLRSRVLQQYFMLTFTYSLKNFGKAPTRANNEERQGFGGMPPGGFRN